MQGSIDPLSLSDFSPKSTKIRQRQPAPLNAGRALSLVTQEIRVAAD